MHNTTANTLRRLASLFDPKRVIGMFLNRVYYAFQALIICIISFTYPHNAYAVQLQLVTPTVKLSPAANAAQYTNIAGAMARTNPWVLGLTVGLALYSIIAADHNGNEVDYTPRNRKQIVPGWANGGVDPVAYSRTTVYWTSSPYTHIKVNADEKMTLVPLWYLTSWPHGTTYSLQENTVNCSGTAASCTYYRILNNTGAVTGPYTMSFNSGAVCKTGYLYQSSTGICGVADPSLIMYPSDGIQTWRTNATGTAFEANPRDPDVINKTNWDKNTHSQITPDGNVQIKPLPSGGVEVKTRSQETVDGQTKTYEQTLTTDADGKIIGSEAILLNGGLHNSSQTQTETQIEIDFPDDYNRESTQQQILDSLNCTDCVIDPNQQPLNEAEIAAISEQIQTNIENVPNEYDALKSYFDFPTWIPEFPSGSCSPIGGNIMGTTIEINLCGYVAMINEGIGWLLSLWGAYTISQMIYRRE